MKYLYLISLIVPIVSMVYVDRRYQLAFYDNFKKTLIVIASSVMMFIVWDILGIALGIFFSGESKYMSGIYLGPEFPIEELLFLSFLSYFTLVVFRFLEVRWLRI